MSSKLFTNLRGPAIRKWWTKRFLRRRQRWILDKARRRRTLLADLQTLDQETKQRLAPRVRLYGNQLAKVEGWADLMFMAALLFFLITALFAVLAAPFLARRWFGSGAGLDTVELYVSYMIPFVVALLPTFIPWVVFRGGFRAWCVVGVTMVYWALLYNLYRTISSAVGPPSLMPDLAPGILGVSSYWTIALFAVVVAATMEYRLKRSKNIGYPDAVVVDGLLSILSMVEREPTRWNDLRFRRRLMAGLEEVALCIEYDLPRALRSGDAGTDYWLRQTVKQIAAAVRLLKRRILTPKLDTRSYFIAEVATGLVQAAGGDWDSLKRVEPEALTGPQPWRRRALAVGRVLLIASLPLVPLRVALVVLQGTPALWGPVATYGMVVALLWATVTFLAAIDPLFSAKISALKDIAQFLPGSGKSEKK